MIFRSVPQPTVRRQRAPQAESRRFVGVTARRELPPHASGGIVVGPTALLPMLPSPSSTRHVPLLEPGLRAAVARPDGTRPFRCVEFETGKDTATPTSGRCSPQISRVSHSRAFSGPRRRADRQATHTTSRYLVTSRSLCPQPIIAALKSRSRGLGIVPDDCFRELITAGAHGATRPASGDWNVAAIRYRRTRKTSIVPLKLLLP